MPLLPDGIGKEELLSYLRPLYPNGIFPLAPGWGIVFFGGMLLAFCGVIFYHSFRMRRRRKAFAELQELRRSFEAGGDISALSAGVSILLRRMAVSCFGLEKAARLKGQDWVDFLIQTGADLSDEEKSLLTVQAYAPVCKEPDCLEKGKNLIVCVQKWMRRNL